MSVWTYREGDIYTDGGLREIKRVTEQNLKSASRALDKYKSYSKYGLPGYRFQVIRQQERVDELLQSIFNLDEAIKKGAEIADRQVDIDNHAR